MFGMQQVLLNAPFWVPRGNGVPANLFADFVNGNYWYAGARQASFQDFINAVGITYSRASSPNAGYYWNSAGVLVQAGTDVPRITYHPTSHALLGIWLERAGTNLALWCRDLTNAAWVPSNMTTALTATGIDGAANSATRLTATGANATILQTPGLGSALRQYSPYIRRVTGSGTIKLTLDGSTFSSDLSGSLNTSTYTLVSTNQTVVPIIGIQIGTSGDVIEVDFNLLEAATNITSPGSPILTTNATATRAGDIFNWPIPFLGWSTTEGSTLVVVAPAVAGGDNYGFNCSDGTSVNFIRTQVAAAGANALVVTTASVNQATISASGANTSAAFVTNKIAAGWRANDFAVVCNGGTVGTDTAGTVPASLNIARLAATAAGVASGDVVTAQIGYWNTRVPNAELQRLTM